MRTGKLDFHETKTLHANFKEFVDKHKDVIGNVLDFAVVSDDSTRNLEVRRWDIMLPLARSFIDDLGCIILRNDSIYWLFNTLSRALQADWLILEYNEKAILNID